MIAAAREEARRIGGEAEARVETRRNRARADASEVVELARIRGGQIEENARADAARVLDNARGKAGRILGEARALLQRVQAVAARRQEVEQGVTAFADRIAAAGDVSRRDHGRGLWARLFRKSERQAQAAAD